MNKKYIIILALSCLFSLGIGVFIGYGVNVQNLSGTAALPNPITNSDGIYSLNGQQYDLQTLMMKLQMERAGQLDNQLTNQANKIKERNTLLAETQKILIEVRSLRPSNDTGTAKMTATIAEFCTQHNISIVGAVGADLKQGQWDQNMDLIKAFMEQLNSASQQDMIALQSVMAKYNQTFEELSNFMSQYTKTRDSIVGNLR